MKRDYKPFLYALYCASIMAMNILATKQIDIFNFTMTCGVFVSGFVFIAQDIMTELYGQKESKKMIFTCYGLSLLMTCIYQIAIAVPQSQFWNMQEAFASILQTTLRITIASFIAYSFGSIANVSIMGELKEKYPKSLFIRAITSTTAGQLLDNGLFSFIAFLGVLPVGAIVSMVVGATLLEILTEIAIYPILKPILKILKAK
jgi:uncharacterized integral membrane protein (TIGR00697 family)